MLGLIGVMDETGHLTTTAPDRLFQGIEGELGAKIRRDLPADDHAGEDVGDEGHVAKGKARLGRDIGVMCSCT